METLHFVLDVTRNENSVTVDIWESDDQFGMPIASADGATADEAIASLFSKLTIHFEEESNV